MTPEQIAAAKLLHGAKWGPRKIAKALQARADEVHRVVHGLDAIEYAIHRYQQGAPVSTLGVKYETLRYQLRKRGLRARRPISRPITGTAE
jgi:hypothetical protein